MKKEKSRKIKIGVSFTVTFVLAVITLLIYKFDLQICRRQSFSNAVAV